MIRIPNYIHISRAVPIGLIVFLTVWTLPWDQTWDEWVATNFWQGLIGMWSFIGLWTLLDRAYTVSYDDNHIVMTGHKWIWPPTWRFPNTILYDGIHAVYGAMGPGGTIQGKFMPFDHIRIEGDITGPYDHIMASPNFLDVEGCRELMRAIYAKRPEVVDEDVVTFMNSDKKW
jgi:hypothetical protein